MADERHLLGVGLIATHLLVEEVTTADEGLGLPPVGIHTVNSSSFFFTIDSDSLVESLLVSTEPAEAHAEVLITALYNLDSISIELANRADGGLCISKLGLESPASGS